MSEKNSHEKKQDDSYSFRLFWKKHIALLIILIFVPLVACAIFIPIVFNKGLNIWDLGSFLGGIVAYIGTTLLGAISMWQNEKLKIENDKNLADTREQAEKDKQYLQEQNEKMAYDNARLSVIPFFSVKYIPYTIRNDVFDTNKEIPNRAEERPLGYTERDSWCFSVKLDEQGITISEDEIAEIVDRKRNVFKQKTDKNGMVLFCERTDWYIPLIIKNIGRNHANGFSIAVYKDGCTDELFYKRLIERPFEFTDSLRLDIYVSDINYSALYWIELRYSDILGNKYI